MNDGSSTVNIRALGRAIGRIDGRRRLPGRRNRNQHALMNALGGESEVSPQEAMAIRRAAESDAIAAALFALMASGDPEMLAAYAPLYATASKVNTAALKLIGMHRRARDALTLTSYLASLPERPAAPSTPAPEPVSWEASA